MRPFFFRHKAFSILEVLMVAGVIAVIGSFVIPLFFRYKVRNDLFMAKSQIVQALQRARGNTLAGKYASPWGFKVDDGILFAGSSFADRDTKWDESYPLPITVQASGLLTVIYDVYGQPLQEGDINLSLATDTQESVNIQIRRGPGVATSGGGSSYGGQTSVQTSGGATMLICHQGIQTMSITSAQWPFHQTHGDTASPCPGWSSSSSSAASSSSTGGMIVICHRPGTLNETTTISSPAWSAHQAHGDTMGPCQPIAE